ncbi:rRNA processing/ribosome biogenesis-domain-containing protein [Polychytrium aggregatum]|uniref:rRNA processing/ribosome biogenesis-domain-containing protein n=1 Tax=Polychytrium aggregatum TaxID=110093 RepID=UPI0022FEA7C7|nr:rRNA processing/ribosome biogenesis-domain-containing protein [Polychytrium aggregatum]KAI9204998.1 rRNA processing/ribosome biogenesis-domain-containing protein [Polychytrium aggregatum]
MDAAKALSTLISKFLLDDSEAPSHLAFISDILRSNRYIEVVDQAIARPEYSGSVPALSSALQKWATRISSLLQSKDEAVRWVAIGLIRLSIAQSPSLFKQSVASWCNIIMSHISRPQKDVILFESLALLLDLVERTWRFPDLVRDTSAPYLHKLIPVVIANLDKSSECFTAISKNLTRAIDAFPTAFRGHIEKLESACLRVLLPTEQVTLPSDFVEAASNILLAVGSLGLQKGDHEDAHMRLQMKLIGTTHSLLDRAFSCIDEEEYAKISYPSFHIPALETARDESRLLILTAWVRTILECLSRSLCMARSGVQSLQSRPYLNLISRIMNVSRGALPSQGSLTIEFESLLMAMASIHEVTMDLLVNLVTRFRAHLLRDAASIWSACAKCLSISEHSTTLRIRAFHAVRRCAQILGPHFVSLSIDHTIVEALKSLEQRGASQTVNLEVQQSKKSKGHDSQNHGLPSDNRPWELKTAAVQAIDAIVSSSRTVEPKFQYRITRALLSTLMTSSVPTYHCDSYDTFKLSLYTCLLDTLLSSSATHSVALAPAIQLFSLGLSDINPEIRELCIRALNITDLIQHARLPPIQRQTHAKDAHLPLDESAKDALHLEQSTNKAGTSAPLASSGPEGRFEAPSKRPNESLISVHEPKKIKPSFTESMRTQIAAHSESKVTYSPALPLEAKEPVPAQSVDRPQVAIHNSAPPQPSADPSPLGGAASTEGSHFTSSRTIEAEGDGNDEDEYDFPSINMDGDDESDEEESEENEEDE